MGTLGTKSQDPHISFAHCAWTEHDSYLFYANNVNSVRKVKTWENLYGCE